MTFLEDEPRAMRVERTFRSPVLWLPHHAGGCASRDLRDLHGNATPGVQKAIEKVAEKE
jgi:hypothetical protein